MTDKRGLARVLRVELPGVARLILERRDARTHAEIHIRRAIEIPPAACGFVFVSLLPVLT
jgi:hypothetical protein